jgi:hypothetical protein
LCRVKLEKPGEKSLDIGEGGFCGIMACEQLGSRENRRGQA